MVVLRRRREESLLVGRRLEIGPAVRLKGQ